MGYDIHISRAKDWANNEGLAISLTEWNDFVESDPELQRSAQDHAHLAVWQGTFGQGSQWLDWTDGNITAKNPDESLLAKMAEIADRLNATVQGDDGELYTAATLAGLNQPSGIASNGPLLSLILSLVALLMIGILITLNYWIRKDYATGDVLPLQWALVVAGFLAVGGVSWLTGTILAIASIIARQPSPYLAWMALAVNGVAASCIMLIE